MFSIKLNKLFVLSLLLMFQLSFAEAGHDKHNEAKENQDTHDDHSGEEESHSDAIQLSPAALKEFGIELDKVQSGEIHSEIQLTGEVAVNEEKVTHISARFEGIIKSVHAKLGQFVGVGKTLAIVENSSNLTSYAVKAKRAGVITFKDAAIGEVVEPGEGLFRISNLSNVWVNLNVYQKDVQKLRSGMQLRIQDPFSKLEVKTKVDYISPIMNEQTRTVTIRATIPSQKGTWKPGMFINGFIVSDSHTAQMRLPKEAVHSYEGNTVVFVQDEGGFEPRTVTLGDSNENYVEVLTGLEVGDAYVSQNGFIVKSELGKSEMSSGHNH